jgi:hypothetical protein
VKTWHGATRVPWLWHGTQRKFIGYDDPRSIAEKAWYLQQWGLGGAMFWELSGDRNEALLGPLDTWLRQRPALAASTGTVSLAAPPSVALSLRGGASRAGRTYFVFAGLTGTVPGLPLPGGVLPLNYDVLVAASASGGPLFPGCFGVLDAQGNANAGIAFPVVPIPPFLLGWSVHASAWVLAPGFASGEPSNPVELRLVP